MKYSLEADSVLLLCLLTLLRNGRCDTKGFLIFHEIPESGGLCLVGKKVGDQAYEAFLSKKCLVENKAWQWTRTKKGMLKNLNFDRCLAVAKTENNQKVTLRSCDPNDNLQQWKCDMNYNLRVNREDHGTGYKYRVVHNLVYHKWEITGAYPILQTYKDAAIKNEKIKKKWMVYSEDGTDIPKTICENDVTGKESKALITTVSGGKVTGKPCIFPFIYKDKERKSCVKKADGDNSLICATTSDMDTNKDSWGVCPKSSSGVMSNWSPTTRCDRPCGGGRLVHTRECLYPPCTGSATKFVKGSVCNSHECSGGRILTFEGFSYMFPVDGVYPVVKDLLYGECVFPFKYKGITTHECITSLDRQREWCSLSEDFDKHKKWGYCAEEYKGAWSTWSTVSEGEAGPLCSRTCGSGLLSMKRICRFPPCKGRSTKFGEKCNTHPCNDCIDPKTRQYSGKTSIASDGSTCQSWDKQEPNKHSETPDKYPELAKNYCRKPLANKAQPYCYILPEKEGSHSDLKTWLYCDIPTCGFDFNAPGIPYTIPVHPYDDPSKYKIGTACHFPFVLDKQMYDRCVSTMPKGREWCRTDKDTFRDQTDIAYCPHYFRGRWSKWKLGDCTKKCGGGKLLSYRICLLAPCIGKSIREEDKECNTMPCTWRQAPGMKGCFHGSGMMYGGKVSRTITGGTCQKWSEQSPVKHHMYPELMPSGMPQLDENYCRNPTPDIRNAPWCYPIKKKHDAHNWEYCDVPRCTTKESQIYGSFIYAQGEQLKPTACLFPFYGLNTDKYGPSRVQYNQCQLAGIPEYPEDIRYCSVTERTENEIADIHSVLTGIWALDFAICPTMTRGTATPWKKTKCSRTCGGGAWLMERDCLNPPCEKLTKQWKQYPCNTEPCPDCFEGDGETYRGTYNVAYTGQTCKPWARVHKINVKDHPELESNYCRNPGAKHAVPWCYTGSKYEETYCDVKHCDKGTIAYTIPKPSFSTTGRPCVFPYQSNSEYFWGCIKKGNDYVCPLEADITNLKDEDFGVCPPSYRGEWSTWKKTRGCTKPCGYGQIVKRRQCLYPPCKGSPVEHFGVCSSFPCGWNSTFKTNVDCYMTNGEDYIGRASTTFNGYKCMKWDSMKPHQHYYIQEYSGKSLNHNFCRNPAAQERKAPWCYTTNKDVRWEYCDVSYCPTNEGEIRTNAVGVRNRLKCKFPFYLDGVEHHHCIEKGKMAVTKEPLYYCITSKKKNLKAKTTVDWGYCPNSVIGTWSAWALLRDNPCTKECGSGLYRYRRVCRMEPCKGEKFKTMHACNTQPCKECYDLSSKGADYKGSKSTTWDGLPCAERKNALGDIVYCRNEKRQMDSPWCYVKGKKDKKSPCGVRHCNETDGKVGAMNKATEKTQFCKFPFRFNMQAHHSCQRDYVHDYLWCSFVDELDSRLNNPSHWGVCYSSYEGTWATWSESGGCTQPCGTGYMVEKRHCRYFVCHGPSLIQLKKCNIHPCDPVTNCYNVTDGGEQYSGPTGRTIYGLLCKDWSKALSQAEMNKYPGVDFINAKCRNPGGISIRPWCPAHDGTYQFCSVPHCPSTASNLIVWMMEKDNVVSKHPCVFPFIYKNKKYTACTSDPPPAEIEGKSGKWCATGHNIDLQDGPKYNDEWGYCEAKYSGTWMQWTHAEKTCTADCVWLLRRSCLLGTCKGDELQLTTERCNIPSCPDMTWSAWSPMSACNRCVSVSMKTRSYKKSCLFPSKTLNCDMHQSHVVACQKSYTESNLLNQADPCKLSHVTHSVDLSQVLELLSAYHVRMTLISSSARTLLSLPGCLHSLLFLFIYCNNDILALF